ncbi:hypothetical protein BDV93DRAFT_474913 [Ceratobasidium sp. AG-I]|nr:hypothetical protein BDV93DRAFT_474913 [Ceratobasidium sp. AG-I]
MSLPLRRCGIKPTQSDYVVALGSPFWNDGANCGRNVTIGAYGKQGDFLIADQCTDCAYGDLRLSPALFETSTSLDVEAFNITWWLS